MYYCFFLSEFAVHCEMTDVALKEEANKKAFEKFAKESSSNCSVEAVQVSERYECQFPRITALSYCSCNWILSLVTRQYFLWQVELYKLPLCPEVIVFG